MAEILFCGFFIFADSETNEQTNKNSQNVEPAKNFLHRVSAPENLSADKNNFVAKKITSYANVFYKSNETKLNEFLKPKHGYLSFVIFHLRLKKNDESLQNP